MVQVLQASEYDVTIFKRFRQLCGWTGLLPTSHTIPEKLVQTTEYPIISGSFGDVWEGIYNDKRVAIKALRVYKTDDVRKVKRVTSSNISDHPLRLWPTIITRSFVRRLRCGSRSPIQTSSHFLGFRRHLHPLVWYPSGCRTEA